MPTDEDDFLDSKNLRAIWLHNNQAKARQSSSHWEGLFAGGMRLFAGSWGTTVQGADVLQIGASNPGIPSPFYVTHRKRATVK